MINTIIDNYQEKLYSLLVEYIMDLITYLDESDLCTELLLEKLNSTDNISDLNALAIHLVELCKEKDAIIKPLTSIQKDNYETYLVYNPDETGLYQSNFTCGLNSLEIK